MRVVMLSPYVPFTGIDHAGGAYLHAYLVEASKSRDIDLFAPRSPENVRGAAEHGTAARIHLVDVPLAPGSRCAARWWNVRNFLRGLTPGWQVLRAFREDESLRRAAAGADLVEVHWDYMLPVVEHLPIAGRPVLAFPYDVVAQVFQRRAPLAGPFSRAALTNLAWRIRRQEVQHLNRTAGCFVFSQKDAGLLQDGGLRCPVHLLDPLVEVPAQPAGLTTSSTLLFVGAMHRPENVDGIRWFLRECWPGVLEGFPTARLVIAGGDPPDDLAVGTANVTVTGWVEDFDDLYRSARAAVVPLRAGAGLKFKVAQAMLWGLPVVTTPVGAEGIVDTAGPLTFAAISTDPGELVRACLRVLTDDAFAHEIGTRARDWASSSYDTEASIRCVVDLGNGMVSVRLP